MFVCLFVCMLRNSYEFDLSFCLIYVNIVLIYSFYIADFFEFRILKMRFDFEVVSLIRGLKIK